MNLFQQDRCLYCHNTIQPDIGWRAIFSIEKVHHLCFKCEEQLDRIDGNACRICNKPFHLLNEKFRDEDLCHDCFRWEEDQEWQGSLEKNLSLFLYNDFLKELLAKYKFRGDYVLAKIFGAEVKKQLLRMNPDFIVPIPLSETRLYERGFNQAAGLVTEAGCSPTEILTRIHSEKQSKKSRLERIHLPQVFKLHPDMLLEGKRIVLVDDIYTTGSTLRHAAKLLKSAGAVSIQSLTLAR
jgi:competence protein ComFC